MDESASFAFWSSVDLTGNQTPHTVVALESAFWSSVDLTGNQTLPFRNVYHSQFWSSADLTGNQTLFAQQAEALGFGAVSI